jgi:hypothetical protein
MGRKQNVMSADQHALAAAHDYFNSDDKTAGQQAADEWNFLPQLDAAARSSAVAEKAPEDKRMQNSISVSIPVAGSSSPAIQPQQLNSQKAFHIFNIESARNIVSAVMQMGFTVHDQETFTAVLVEKVRCKHRLPSSARFPAFFPHLALLSFMRASLTVLSTRCLLSFARPNRATKTPHPGTSPHPTRLQILMAKTCSGSART